MLGFDSNFVNSNGLTEKPSSLKSTPTKNPGKGVQLLLTGNLTKDFYSERPSGRKRRTSLVARNRERFTGASRKEPQTTSIQQRKECQHAQQGNGAAQGSIRSTHKPC